MMLTPSKILDTCQGKLTVQAILWSTPAPVRPNTCHSCLIFGEIFVGKEMEIFVHLYLHLCGTSELVIVVSYWLKFLCIFLLLGWSLASMISLQDNTNVTSVFLFSIFQVEYHFHLSKLTAGIFSWGECFDVCDHFHDKCFNAPKTHCFVVCSGGGMF